jgi:hypothetical protein
MNRGLEGGFKALLYRIDNAMRLNLHGCKFYAYQQHYGSIFTDFTTAGSWLPKFVLLKERSGLYYFL